MDYLDLREIREFHDLRKQLLNAMSALYRKQDDAHTWKVAVMIACEATTAANIAMSKAGYMVPGGAALKNGFE